MAETLTRRVVKATTLLSSTQGVSMVCGVVRMKLLAVLVGPLGVGLVGVLMQVLDTIGRVTQLSIRTSAVRDLATTTSARHRSAVRHSVMLYGRLLGVLGMVIMFVLAPWISDFTLGTRAYSWLFRIASASLLFQSLQASHHIVLQASSRYSAVATSSVVTALLALALTVPLYMFLRIDGIAPSVVAYAVVGWLAAMWFTRRDKVEHPAPSLRSSLREGRGFVKVGFFITLTSFIIDVISLGFMRYIQGGGDTALGLYQAGYTLLWRYTGVFFMAYGMEFYPRVSKCAHAPERVRTLVTHQALVSLAMLLPCALVVIPLTPWFIRLLYSSEFAAAVPYVVWGMAGMLFRPLSAAVSYAFLASNHSMVYCFTEFLYAVMALAINILGFHYGGFTGLGISTVVQCAVDVTIMLVAMKLCGVGLPRRRAIFATIGAVCVGLCMSAICSVMG